MDNPLNLPPGYEQNFEHLLQEVLEKMEREKLTPLEVLGLDKDYFEGIYSQAYNYYQQGDFKKALSLFYFLSGADPKSYKYVFGMAASLAQLKDYEAAAITFTQASSLDLCNPVPLYHAAQNFIQAGQTEDARMALKRAFSLAGDDPAYQALKERCKLLEKSISI